MFCIYIYYVALISYRASLGVKLVGALINDKNIPQGAATTVYGAVSPVVGTPGMRGVYLSDCGAAPPRTVEARDATGSLAKELYDVTHLELEAAVKAAGLA